MKKIKNPISAAICAALSLLCALVVLMLARHDPAAAPKALTQLPDPSGTVESFAAALTAGDRAAARALCPDLFLPDPPAPDTQAATLAALAENSLRVQGRVTGTEGVRGTALLEVSYIDLPSLTAELQPDINARLSRYVEEAALASEIYDADKQYREDVVLRAWDEILQERIDRAEEFRQTGEIPVNLSYNGTGWQIEAAAGLTAPLQGGIPGGAGQGFESFLAARRSGALEGLVYIPKLYRLSYDPAVPVPAPDPAGYRTVPAPEQVSALPGAAALIGDTEPAFASALLEEGSGFSCYADESILTVVWHEKIIPAEFTYCEVYIADGSQLRRKIAEDTYGSSVLKYPTEYAAEANAVLATDADFYRYRGNLGVNVYDGEVYKFAGEAVDSCFFTRGGDMLFAYAGEITGEEQARDFVAQNDILTGVSFGPVLVDGGVNVTPERYPIGETYDPLARCVFCQLGPRHYLICAVDYYYTVDKIADLLVDKGVQKAYNMDGGQSSAIILGGVQQNRNIFGAERAQSDILYFATAVPEEERAEP